MSVPTTLANAVSERHLQGSCLYRPSVPLRHIEKFFTGLARDTKNTILGRLYDARGQRGVGAVGNRPGENLYNRYDHPNIRGEYDQKQT